MHALDERPLGEAAVGAGEHVLLPTTLASRTSRCATSSGCSMTFVWCVTTPGISFLPSGSGTSSHTRHSCSCRALACSMT